MKHTISLLLALVMALVLTVALTACSDSGAETETSEP